MLFKQPKNLCNFNQKTTNQGEAVFCLTAVPSFEVVLLDSQEIFLPQKEDYGIRKKEFMFCAAGYLYNLLPVVLYGAYMW